MKILLAHNYYLNPGGEDQVFAAEAEVLRAHGEEVCVYTIHNSRIASMGKLSLARSTIWNSQVMSELGSILREFEPDVVHFHNTFPLISPAAYYAARELSIPVVQTLHNFRLLCLNGLFLRNGAPCEDCLGRTVAWPGVLHGCYRQSKGASAVVAAMVGGHRLRGTWRDAIDAYIAVSEFARSKFVAGGLPADRIVVKPNFLAQDPGVGTHAGGFALYVGRLSPEKGIAPLIRLWSQLTPSIPLRVIGGGVLESLAAKSPPTVEWLGWQPRDQVLAAMKDATFLVFPTECYEGFPIVLVEAMATGLPVLAADRGSVPEIVHDGRTGVLVRGGDSERWLEALHWAADHPQAMTEMGRCARREFESKYTGEVGYRSLSRVYQQARQYSGGRLPEATLGGRTIAKRQV
jgi:glycosyltransferase involved in cell wall biosynthesis